MAVDVDAIKARLAAATPGPWEWRNTDARVRLTRRSDNGLVMSFARCGMQDAQPVLRGSTGFHERTSRRNLYEFPDADFIAHAPSDIAALVEEVERLRKVEREHTDDCGRFVECGGDGRTCTRHPLTLVDDERGSRCVWCTIERLRTWQRAVADALGISEGPGEGIPWHCEEDPDRAAEYASDAMTYLGEAAENERLRKVAEAAAEAIDAKTERDGLSYYGPKPEGWGDKMDANTARSRSAYVLLVAAVREWREAGE